MKSFFKNYIVVENNIYGADKLDASLYCAVYIAIPIIITVVGLMKGLENSMDFIYWYISITITTIGALYDCYGRWNSSEKSLKNSKVFFMGLSAIAILVYSFYEIVCISQGVDNRNDVWLLSYAILVVIAIADLTICFSRNMTFGKKVKEVR